MGPGPVNRFAGGHAIVNLFRYRRLALAVLVTLITIVGLVTMHVVVGYFPWQSGSFPEDVSWKMVSAARMLGVLVPLLIMVQVSLVVRIPLFNALFGLPGLIRAHRILAGIILVLALGHFPWSGHDPGHGLDLRASFHGRLCLYVLVGAFVHDCVHGSNLWCDHLGQVRPTVSDP
jgi:hypothetical protein